METYEALIIFPSHAAADALAEGKNAFEETLKKYEGKVLNRTEMGRRALGYPVKKSREGYFAAFDFELAADKVEPLSHTLRLSDGVIKFTIVRKPKARVRRIAKPSTKPASSQTHSTHSTSTHRPAPSSTRPYNADKARSH